MLLGSSSEQTRDADLGMGKYSVVNPITSGHTDATEGKAEVTGQGGANPWASVPTEKGSLANLAPVLLPYFNNGPVFGLPGTEPASISRMLKVVDRDARAVVGGM